MNTKGFKGFNKNFKCIDFQFSEGVEFSQDGDPVPCEKGFHFCEDPLDVFNYYPPDGSNVYASVEAMGKIVQQMDKSITNKIYIDKKISLSEMFKLSFKAVVKLCKDSIKANTSGYESHANTSGNRSHANTSGDRSHANTSGNRSHANTSGNGSHANTSGNRSHANTSGYESNAIVNGKNSIACAVGCNSKAMAGKNGALVLTEWDSYLNLRTIKAVKVDDIIDGIKIEPNTFYHILDGKVVKS